ncbi:MAG: hypothetical protein K8S18_04420 [Desulfobacula sp.]|nr:hypothetical protein [Desulfobacula sp.]
MGKFDSLNYVVKRYNETRDFLTTEMKEYKFNKGMAFTFGFMQPGFLYEFGLQFNRSKLSAKGTPENDTREFQRDLYIRMTNLCMDIGFPFGEGVAIAPGMGFNFNFFRYLTRVAPPDQIKGTDKEKSNMEIGMHLKFFVKIILGGIEDNGLSFFLEPYYHLGIWPVDITGMNESINPGTYQNDPSRIREKFNYFGLRFVLAVRGG